MGTMIIDGLEWYVLLDITKTVLTIDDSLRKEDKTILHNRSKVEKAKEELGDIENRARKWRVYTHTGCKGDSINSFKTEDPEWMKEQFSDVFMVVPDKARINMDKKGVALGIADACCKIMALGNSKIEDFEISDDTMELAEDFWNRSSLHFRRSFGAYEDIPDFREEKYHEGAKLVYDLNNLEEEKI